MRRKRERRFPLVQSSSTTNCYGVFQVPRCRALFVALNPRRVSSLATDPRMSKNSKVLNLKDKICGNEVDLSLCDVTEVPVRELVSQFKAI